MFHFQTVHLKKTGELNRKSNDTRYGFELNIVNFKSNFIFTFNVIFLAVSP